MLQDLRISRKLATGFLVVVLATAAMCGSIALTLQRFDRISETGLAAGTTASVVGGGLTGFNRSGCAVFGHATTGESRYADIRLLRLHNLIPLPERQAA